MKPTQKLLSVIALNLLSASAFASTVVYNSSASFLPHVASGAYLEGFDAPGLPPLGTVSYSGGAYSYNVFAQGDLYGGTGFLGAAEPDTNLVITFTSGNVTAFGANFFATNFNDAFVSVSVTLTLSDGTIETFTPTSAADSYRGFVSTSAISSVTFAGPGAGNYAGLDNFTVGAQSRSTVQVPEPAGLALVGLGLAAAFTARRRAA